MQKGILVLFSLGLLALGISGCAAPVPAAQTAVRPQTQTTRQPLPETVYYVDLNGDGNFQMIRLQDKPQPKQGQDRWARDFYVGVKYPPSARENGISGIVILDVLVKEDGMVESVDVKKGISKDCDAEAKRAFLASTTQGYVPLILNSVPVKFKMEIPVGYWLE